MGRVALPLTWALCLVCSALGCRAIIGLEEAEPYPDPSASGAGASGAGGSGGVSHTTTTGGFGAAGGTGGMAGAGPSCEEVDLEVGETVGCQDCVATICCSEYLECSEDETRCDGLMTCGGAFCEYQCLYAVCDSGLAFLFHKYCADCLSESCCQEYSDCAANTACMDCVTEIDTSGCDASTLDEAVQDCTDTNCQDHCF